MDREGKLVSGNPLISMQEDRETQENARINMQEDRGRKGKTILIKRNDDLDQVNGTNKSCTHKGGGGGGH